MSQNHQTCIDRVWGNLDDLDNAHNIWLKDLQQRRQTRHLSLVNPIHFISLHHQRCYMQVHVKQLDCWIITFFGQSNHFLFSTHFLFSAPSGPCCLRRLPGLPSKQWTLFICGQAKIHRRFNHRPFTPTGVGNPSTRWTLMYPITYAPLSASGRGLCG